MYANDLILASKATRKIDRNCNLYLSIYSKLTGQHPNYSKSIVLFPSWVSKWFVKSIFSILNFRIGSFPFTYVGVMITPKRIKISPIKPMVSHISNITNVWNHSNFSKAWRMVMINSTILSIPNYYMSTYPVPDCILDSISKLVRDFLWNKLLRVA